MKGSNVEGTTYGPDGGIKEGCWINEHVHAMDTWIGLRWIEAGAKGLSRLCFLVEINLVSV